MTLTKPMRWGVDQTFKDFDAVVGLVTQ
jgi:hypothetical protein